MCNPCPRTVLLPMSPTVQNPPIARYWVFVSPLTYRQAFLQRLQSSGSVGLELVAPRTQLAEKGPCTFHVSQVCFNFRQAQNDLGPLVAGVGLAIMLSRRLQHSQLGVAPGEVCPNARVVAVRQILAKVPRGPAIRADTR